MTVQRYAVCFYLMSTGLMDILFQKFKHAIAAYVASLAGITPEQALKTIEVPKKDGFADLCVCIPKINQFNKLKGNPGKFQTFIASF